MDIMLGNILRLSSKLSMKMRLNLSGKNTKHLRITLSLSRSSTRLNLVKVFASLVVLSSLVSGKNSNAT